MPALLRALQRLAILRWLGSAFCALAMLCATAATASALEGVQAKTRVWGFELAEHHSAELERSATQRTRLAFSPSYLEPASGSPHAARAGAKPVTTLLSDVTVVSRGKVIGRGTVDLRGTLEAIKSGKLSPRDVFKNREGLLPAKPSGYYKEYYHPTPGVKGTGPERIIQGEGGELFYTPDHYGSFIPLN